MQAQLIETGVKEGIATIQLNNPPANSCTYEMMKRPEEIDAYKNNRSPNSKVNTCLSLRNNCLPGSH